MNNSDNQLKKRLLADKQRERTVTGSQGIAMISHGSEVTISVKTPLGRLYRVETTFIGTNATDDIFLELPAISQTDYDDYFFDGFWLTVNAISEKGEGAIVKFKTQISQVIHKPLKLLILTLPSTMTLRPLRTEPRYEVRLQGMIALPNRMLRVDFKDLSSSGCCFIQEVNGPQFNEDSKIRIEIRNTDDSQCFQLTGVVRNIHRAGALNYCGVMFDNQGQKQARRLLAQLIFDGSKLSFKHT